MTSIFTDTYRTIVHAGAKFFYGNPSKAFFIVIVTGSTNKTSTARILHILFSKLIGKTALYTRDFTLIGTEKGPTPTYTPFNIQSFLATAKAGGCQLCIFTCDENAINTGFLDGLEIDMVILTNVSQTYSPEYHTSDEYANIYKQVYKKLLLTNKPNKIAIFPKDDKYGNKRYNEFSFNKTSNYGIISNATLQATDIKAGSDGAQCNLLYLGQNYQLHTSILGQQGLYALLGAMSACVTIGITIQTLLATIPHLPNNLVQFAYEITKENVRRVYVHPRNGKSIKKIIDYYRALPDTKNILAVGCALGNISPKQVGEAIKETDYIIITSPTEEKTDIKHFHELQQGCERKEGQKCISIAHRKGAFYFAKKIVKKGDVVIVVETEKGK